MKKKGKKDKTEFLDKIECFFTVCYYVAQENCLDVVQIEFLTVADLDSLPDSKALDKTTPKR